jgi:hypothetical protein
MTPCEALAALSEIVGEPVTADILICGDSLEFLHLVNQIEVIRGRVLEKRELAQCKTYGDLAALMVCDGPFIPV